MSDKKFSINEKRQINEIALAIAEKLDGVFVQGTDFHMCPECDSEHCVINLIKK